MEKISFIRLATDREQVLLKHTDTWMALAVACLGLNPSLLISDWHFPGNGRLGEGNTGIDGGASNKHAEFFCPTRRADKRCKLSLMPGEMSGIIIIICPGSRTILECGSSGACSQGRNGHTVRIKCRILRI